MSFHEFLLSLGFKQESPPLADGRWHRCATETHPRRKNGSWKLAPDGQVGWAQDFALMPEPVTWRPEQASRAPPSFDPVALRRAHEESQRKAAEATEAARLFYNRNCRPLVGGHPYLASHGLGMDGCYGLKVDGKGWLVVPALRGRAVSSVQRISPDGEKLFWPGASVKGSAYLIDRRDATLTIVCEGLATGLALYAAVPRSRIVVAFNAGNLRHVSIPYAGLLLFAADNDSGTEARLGTNPGVKAAREAAEAFSGGIAVPEGIEGTDWCDLRQERIQQRLSKRLLGSRETEAMIRRDVDAGIARVVMKAAKYRAPEHSHG